MRLALSSILLALCLSLPAHGADKVTGNGPAADVAAINKVVEQFKAAIIAHDGKTLGSLFLQDHDSWLSVADDGVWAKVKARNPKARKVFPGSWKKFAEMIQNADKPVEERFYNVRIDTNGAVASVWFDFDFLDDGKVTNRGSESWQMVRAEDGWKISSMLFSMGD
ncbi:nuclear transport factor 2 family protein [Massilia sp. G4R7]|uniref:Nuclear transport factor 2 family protein n=1 Tax=Massilia phyllostachyos TaxID=2898585 RepID=A0ABS8Q2A0_9BURK|nr:nuclear transport factor 2 family protein [Massilia phyllostachyos]MCD2515212.1 nuclear transport factor 2 family protein [Massilia phyllostachyos]